MDFTNEEIEHLITLKAASRRSYADLAESELGDRGLAVTLRSAIRKYKKVSLPNPEPIIARPVLLAPQVNTLVIADLHTPYQNTKLLQTAIELAKSARVIHVDIAGDLHNFNALSPLSKGEPTTTVDVDIRHSRQILTVLADNFAEIRIVSGNHDEYFIKKKGGTFQDLIYNEVLQGKLSTQVIATNYDYLLRGDDWVIGHLSSYDEEAGKLAAKIADRMNRNVLVGHDHLWGAVRSEKGFIGASIGAMLTPDRFWYKARRLNTFADFALGFAMIVDNELYMFSETGNGPLNGSYKDFTYWRDYYASR